MNNIKKLLIIAGIVGALCVAQVLTTAHAAPILQPPGGGLGTNVVPASGTIPIGNGAGTYTPATLTPGTNVTIVNASGSITINSSEGGGSSSGTVFLINGQPFITTSTINFQQGSNITISSSSNGTYTFSTVAASGTFTTVLGIGNVTTTSSGATTTVFLTNSGVISGGYSSPNIQVSSSGIVTSISNGTFIQTINGTAGNYHIYATGPLTIASGTSSSTLSCATCLTTSTGLTILNFLSPNISQWTNDAGYVTSTSGGSGTVGPSTSTYVAVFTGTSTLLGYAPFTYNSSTQVVAISNEIDIGASPQKLYQDSNGGLRYQDNAGDGNGKQSIFTIHSPTTDPQEGDLSIVRSGTVNSSSTGSIWWDFSNQCYGTTGYTQLNCTVGPSAYGTFDEIQGINGSSSFAPFRIGWWNQNLGAEATNTVLEVQYNPSSSVAFGPLNDQSSTDNTYAMTILSTSTYNTNGILALSTSTGGAYVFTVDNSGNVSTTGIFNTSQTYDIGGSVKLSTNSGNTIVRSSNGIGLDINSNGTFGACALCVATSGFIGIGTSTPSDFVTANATSGYVSFRANSGAVQGYFGANTAYPGINVGSISNNNLSFDTNNQPVGFFDTNGNLWLGSSSSTADAELQADNDSTYAYGLNLNCPQGGSNGEMCIFNVQPPNTNPQEADLSLSRTDAAGHSVGVDWDSECYTASTTSVNPVAGSPCADNYDSIDIRYQNGGLVQPFAIRQWNQNLGPIAPYGVFWMQLATNSAAAFGTYGSIPSSTWMNNQFNILSQTSSTKAFEIDDGTAGSSSFSITPAGVINTQLAHNSFVATDGSGNLITTSTTASAGTVTTSTAVTTSYYPFWGTSSGLTGTSSIQAIGGGANTTTLVLYGLNVGGNLNVTGTISEDGATSTNCLAGILDPTPCVTTFNGSSGAVNFNVVSGTALATTSVAVSSGNTTTTITVNPTLASTTITATNWDATTTGQYGYFLVAAPDYKFNLSMFSCQNVAATTTYDIFRATSSVNTAGVDVASSTCGTTETDNTTFATSSIPAGTFLIAHTVSTAGTPTRDELWVHGTKQ